MSISIINMKKNYQNDTQVITALENISFTIQKGSFTVVLGPSGSGKTSLLNCIGAMDSFSEGKILIDNIEQSFKTDKEMTNYRKKTIGFVFQSYNVLPTLTVYENIDLVRNKDMKSTETISIIKRVGLEKRINHYPNELSGGELQRLCIARAICKNSDLLICDEPTGALDSITGKKILELLKELVDSENKTVLLATHNLKIASLANQVIYLLDGHITEIKENKRPLATSELTDW